MKALLPGHPVSLKRGVVGFVIAHDAAKLGLHLWIAGIAFSRCWWLGLILLFLYPYSRYLASLGVLWGMWEYGLHAIRPIAWCLLASMALSALELVTVIAMERNA